MAKNIFNQSCQVFQDLFLYHLTLNDLYERYQVWRYLTYMLIHSGLFHAIFNILIQLILGLPLEMVNGWWRVMLVYCSGVLAGSLWTSVLKPDKFLAGASGGGKN